MDKTGERAWSAPAINCVATACAAALTALGAVWMALTGDRVGTLLFGVVTLGMGYLGVTATVLRPRLQADGHGVTVRGVRGERRLPWAELTVRISRTHHWGRESTTLELDHGESMILLGRWELGSAPTLVAEQLEAARPRRPGKSVP